jgi:Flp pilus assembly pilin Flp
MLEYINAAISTLRTDEDGQTAVEYALVLLLISIALALALASGLTGALDTAVLTIKNAI